MTNPVQMAGALLKRGQGWLQDQWRRVPKEKFKVFARPSIILVFALVSIWNVLISGRFLDRRVSPAHPVFKAFMDTAKELRDLNLNLQMRLYQPITRRAIPLRNDKVRIVYIDDNAHWGRDMYGNIPTNRKALAKLILYAAQSRTRAAAIGLDIELFMPIGGEDPIRTQTPPAPQKTSGETAPPVPPCLEHGLPSPGTEPDLIPFLSDCNTPHLDEFSDDGALAEAVRFAQGNGVPVVLGSFLYDDHGQHQLKSLYSPKDLGVEDCKGSLCSGYGYLNLPEDKRQVPITEEIEDTDTASRQVVDSFSFKLAKAAANSEDILVDPQDITPAREAFGTFLPEEAFDRHQISFVDLSNANPRAKQECANHVVLIGGHWSGENGYGDPVDRHRSPAGDISGVALHATYIEALLAHQISHEWSFWTNFCFDIGLGLVIFYVFESIEETKKKVKFLTYWGLAPLAGAWISMAALNKYLDFLFPVELYFLHILITTWEQHFHRKSAEHGDPPAPKSA